MLVKVGVRRFYALHNYALRTPRPHSPVQGNSLATPLHPILPPVAPGGATRSDNAANASHLATEQAMLFQALESRRHFSVSHSLDAAGTLTVYGDAAND